ncbi:MAG: helix-turn-helix transcriptional regulator [Thauera sp.]|nr:helix-turn-helix transcriptional regulator [Thauera sp.]
MLKIDLDLDRYDEIVSAVYEAALDTPRWAEALGLFKELFDANYMTLILRTPDEGNLGLMIAIGLEGGDKVSYLAYPHTSTPFVNLPVDAVFTVEDLMSEAEWRRSPYFMHWCAPRDVYHVMGVDFMTEGAGKLRLRITRGENQQGFSALDRARCEAFLPHLKRALRVHNLIDRSESLGSLYSQAIGRLSVGTIVLDDTGRVLEQNLIASQILMASDGLKIVGGRLEASYPSDNRELQQLIRNAFARHRSQEVGIAEAMSVSRPSGLVSLGVVVETVPTQEWMEGRGQPAAVVYIRDAAGKSMASSAAAKQLFNLTPAETALAMELANGLSLEEAAEVLNIRRNTARAHLRSIFSKTGVRRQTELVRIMLNSVAALSHKG